MSITLSGYIMLYIHVRKGDSTVRHEVWIKKKEVVTDTPSYVRLCCVLLYALRWRMFTYFWLHRTFSCTEGFGFSMHWLVFRFCTIMAVVWASYMPFIICIIYHEECVANSFVSLFTVSLLCLEVLSITYFKVCIRYNFVRQYDYNHYISIFDVSVSFPLWNSYISRHIITNCGMVTGPFNFL